MERGWNPMNKALLNNEDPLLTKKKVPATVAASLPVISSPSAVQASTVASELNFDTRAAAAMLDVLVNHCDGEAAHERKMEEKQRATDANTQLKNAKRITSGVCDGTGECELNGNPRDPIKERMEVKEQEAQEKGRRRIARAERFWDRVRTAKAKQESEWNVDERSQSNGAAQEREWQRQDTDKKG